MGGRPGQLQLSRLTGPVEAAETGTPQHFLFGSDLQVSSTSTRQQCAGLNLCFPPTLSNTCRNSLLNVSWHIWSRAGRSSGALFNKPTSGDGPQTLVTNTRPCASELHLKRWQIWNFCFEDFKVKIGSNCSANYPTGIMQEEEGWLDSLWVLSTHKHTQIKGGLVVAVAVPTQSSRLTWGQWRWWLVPSTLPPWSASSSSSLVFLSVSLWIHTLQFYVLLWFLGVSVCGWSQTSLVICVHRCDRITSSGDVWGESNLQPAQR